MDPYGLKAGDAFPTPEAAALDVLKIINPISISKNLEYAGVIYQIGKSFYATDPEAGDFESSNALSPFARKTMHDAAGMPVGNYHTHGNYARKICDKVVVTDKAHSEYLDDEFSEHDEDLSKIRLNVFKKWTSYLGTPSGQFFRYDPSTDHSSQIN